jgi:hypothetical protein
MKRCSRCGETKPREQFRLNATSHDGLQSYCKPCQIENNRIWRERNPKVGARAKLTTAEQRAVKERFWQNNPGSRSAHRSLYKAVRSGRVLRPENCEKCGKAGRLHAHHEDYSRPLDVHWLCVTCHRRLHAGLPISPAAVSVERVSS